MIEIIAVLLILGILTAAAVARFSSTDPYTLATQTELIKSHLRYAGLQSMGSSSPWGIHFSSGSSYSLFRNGNTADIVQILGESSNVVTLPSGVAVSPVPGVVAFDNWGRPSISASASPIANTDLSLSVSYGGGAETIAVIRNTGYIP